jgi:hypothetical protein
MDLLYGALTLIVLLIGAWSKGQDRRLDLLESFQKETYSNREKDAKEYVTKTEFNSLLKEVKDALIRIETRLQNLKDSRQS